MEILIRSGESAMFGAEFRIILFDRNTAGARGVPGSGDGETDFFERDIVVRM